MAWPLKSMAPKRASISKSRTAKDNLLPSFRHAAQRPCIHFHDGSRLHSTELAGQSLNPLQVWRASWMSPNDASPTRRPPQTSRRLPNILPAAHINMPTGFISSCDSSESCAGRLGQKNKWKSRATFGWDPKPSQHPAICVLFQGRPCWVLSTASQEETIQATTLTEARAQLLGLVLEPASGCKLQHKQSHPPIKLSSAKHPLTFGATLRCLFN